MQYKRGKENSVANGLSRRELNVEGEPAGITATIISSWTQEVSQSIWEGILGGHPTSHNTFRITQGQATLHFRTWFTEI